MQTFYDLLKVFIENERVLPSGSLHSVLQSRIFTSTFGTKNSCFSNSHFETINNTSSLKKELLTSFRERGITPDFLTTDDSEPTILKYLLVEMTFIHLQNLFTSNFGYMPMSTRAKKSMSVNELSACLAFVQAAIKEMLRPNNFFHHELLKKVKTSLPDKKFASLDLREERLVGPIIFQNLEINNGRKSETKDESFKRKSKQSKEKLDDLKQAIERLKNENNILMEEVHQMKFKENFKRPQCFAPKPPMRFPTAISNKQEVMEIEKAHIEPRSYRTPVKSKRPLLELSLSAIKTKGEGDTLNFSDISSLANIISKVDTQRKSRKSRPQNYPEVRYEQKKFNAHPNDFPTNLYAAILLVISLLLYCVLLD